MEIFYTAKFVIALNNEQPQYLFSLVRVRRTLYSARNALNIPLLNTNHNFFENSFFPSTIIEWNKLDLCLRKDDTLSLFKTNVLTFIRPSPHSVHNCHNPKGPRLRLGLSHSREHKFKRSFQIRSILYVALALI